MVTTREPEWDDVDRAMVDAYLNWKADQHTCGRPMSESLKDPDKPNPDYQVATEVCLACMALDKHLAEQSKKDKPLIEAGRHPDAWRQHEVIPLAELPNEVREEIIATRRKKPQPDN